MTKIVLDQHDRDDFTSPLAKRARLDDWMGDMLPSSSQVMHDFGTPLPVEHSLPSPEPTGEDFSHDAGSLNFDRQASEFSEFNESLSYANDVAPIDNCSTNSSTSAFTPAFSQREFCFGMISDIPITEHHSPAVALDASMIPLKFFQPNQLFQVGKSSALGEMNDRLAKILSNLGSEEGIAFQIYCKATNKRADYHKQTSSKPGAKKLQHVINIIIYGPEELCDSVGDYLTKCGICLQTPLLCDRDVPYRNPQMLSRSKELVMTSTFSNKELSTKLEKYLISSDLFSKLSNSSDNHFALTNAPDVVITPLYTHQKRGLTFMLQREVGQQYGGSETDLWVKEINEFGQTTYTNTITEMSQSNEPPHSRGGLLADQMGLGKSLMMISLIALNRSRTSGLIHTEQGLIRRIKSTLLVVPYSLLETWHTQLERHLHANTISWIRFHGHQQKRKILSLGQFDIVITTFETLASEHKRHSDSTYVKDTLFSYFWHRIVLDEAHIIRNRTTEIARASCAIKATSRWAITGTPIQNRVTDFASLLEFLQIVPFSDPKVFDREIIKPWLKSDERDITRLKKLVNSTSLCRTKAIIDLPKRRDVIRILKFSSEEQELYDSVKEKTIKKMDTALSSSPLQSNQYLNVLQWLNELRLLCNHGLAHSKRDATKAQKPGSLKDWNKAAANDAFKTMVCAGEARCFVCLEMLRDGVGGSVDPDIPKPRLSKCLVLICGSCKNISSKSQQVSTCSHNPLCKSFEVSWSPDKSSDSDLKHKLPTVTLEHIPTKLKTLLRDLQSSPKDEKSVVFSYWTFTLDLVEVLLQQASISYTRIDGRYSGTEREEAIRKYQADETIQIILVSITCGGTGLDLTAASVAYILEPQWNPMMEEQALCRIHRLGQRKEVKTVRYIIENSFEERVVATQEFKDEIAAEAFGLDVRGEVVTSMGKLQKIREKLG